MAGWSIPLDQLADRSKAKLDTVVRAITMNLFVAVVKRSPVATGRSARTGTCRMASRS